MNRVDTWQTDKPKHKNFIRTKLQNILTSSRRNTNAQNSATGQFY